MKRWKLTPVLAAMICFLALGESAFALLVMIPAGSRVGGGSTQPKGWTELLEDEKKFIDLPNSPLWFAYEYPQVNPTEDLVAREHSTLIKLFFCLRHPTKRSLDEAQLYWRTNHGPLIRGVSQGMRMKRYLQVHYYEEAIAQQLRAGRGTTVPAYTGHAEAWFDRGELTTIASTPEGKRAMELAVEDEAKFIDFPRSAMWIGKERVFIDRR